MITPHTVSGTAAHIHLKTQNCLSRKFYSGNTYNTSARIQRCTVLQLGLTSHKLCHSCKAGISHCIVCQRSTSQVPVHTLPVGARSFCPTTSLLSAAHHTALETPRPQTGKTQFWRTGALPPHIFRPHEPHTTAHCLSTEAHRVQRPTLGVAEKGMRLLHAIMGDAMRRKPATHGHAGFPRPLRIQPALRCYGAKTNSRTRAAHSSAHPFGKTCEAKSQMHSPMLCAAPTLCKSAAPCYTGSFCHEGEACHQPAHQKW